MAAYADNSLKWTFILLLLGSFWISAESARTKTKIYMDLKTQSSCFRHLNATHQLGCASSQSGNVGVVYYIQQPEDFDWVLKEGPHAPYVVVMESVNFTGENVRRLYKSPDRVVGIMVINVLHENRTTSLYPPDGFSTSDSCPNDMSGMYRDSDVYGGCKKLEWNPPGSGLMRDDLGIPVFALSEESDVQKVLQNCFFKFNKQLDGRAARDYPLCAAEVKAFMFAAVDTVTCLRRSQSQLFSLSGTSDFCDPLGDRNSHVTMMDTPQNENRPDDSVIVVGARMDTSALFNLEYKSADTAVTGLVSLLATMEALWKTKATIKRTRGAKDIMFALFRGETYDYIGSSSMVHSMQEGTFPQSYSSGSKETHLHKIGLQHINQFVELNQVGYRNDADSLWMHTDPDNLKVAGNKIKAITDGLIQVTRDVNVTFNPADETLPLPPASAQRFLMERPDIPVVVVTDHSGPFTNKFYNSRLDDAELINADYPAGLREEEKYDYITTQAEQIAGLSTVLARYLYQASTGLTPDDDMKRVLTANSSTVTHMLYCFLISPNCELFKETVSAANAVSLESTPLPYPFYVGVYSPLKTQEVTTLASSLMARFSGDIVNLSKSDCQSDGKDLRYTYNYVQGNLLNDGKSRPGWCLKSLVQITDAYSPAFTIDGYDMMSGKYSTWTESRWANDAFSIRLFLVPSHHLQVSIFAAGCVVLVLSMLIVYWCGANANRVYTNEVAGTGTQTTYSPMF